MLTKKIAVALIASASIVLFSSVTTFAQGKGHPCAPLRQACTGAGFIVNTAGKGTGLWKDCVCPILNGSAQPANAKLKLPSVDPGTVSACKAARPNLCHGK